MDKGPVQLVQSVQGLLILRQDNKDTPVHREGFNSQLSRFPLYAGIQSPAACLRQKVCATFSHLYANWQ
ncbi:hypothetical protein D2Q93_16120 [Alicyclobacillaceae bacterium I2511]|nr:hypothetical protein D2Q93_16120 [Alicyclobacillaceae bacterium I2511]